MNLIHLYHKIKKKMKIMIIKRAKSINERFSSANISVIVTVSILHLAQIAQLSSKMLENPAKQQILLNE